MSLWRKLLLCLALVPAVSIVVAGVSLKALTAAKLDSGTETIHFEVRAGDSLIRVASDLASQNIVAHPRLLTLFARAMGQTNIKRGEYLLEGNQSDLAILEQLVAGRVMTRQVTLVEGTRWRHALATLAAAPHLAQTVAHLSSAEVAKQLGLDAINPEGWLFPDTYHYTRQMSDMDILRMSVERMRQVLAEEWANRADDLPYNSPYEALIMASIVEKETAVPAERADIAGVFVRRLQRGMRLQTDPTVIYGLGEHFDGNIRRHHLKQSTPYNTYVIKGLPPTPIALAGREAIHAALHPKAGEALYFVAKGDGSHQFSASLDAHVEAVRQYQLRRTADYRSTPHLSD